MKAELVFNDRSVCEAPSRGIASQWLSEMVSTLADLIDTGICTPKIHTNRDLYEIDLIPDEYGFQEWVVDKSTDPDLRQLAWMLSTQSPVHQGLLESVLDTDEFERSDFRTADDLDCIALGVALAWDGIAISLPSHDDWRLSEIPISQHLYDADLTKFSVVLHRVRQASRPEHVDPVVESWRRSARAGIASANELVDNWDILFPNLDLCEEYRHKTLPALQDRVVLRSVVERLIELNIACNHWSGPTPEYGFRARPESPETMANDQRKRQRLATCPRLGEHYFVMHCNIQPSGYRLYWLENARDRRLCVGYTGPHLETARHKAQ